MNGRLECGVDLDGALILVASNMNGRLECGVDLDGALILGCVRWLRSDWCSGAPVARSDHLFCSRHALDLDPTETPTGHGTNGGGTDIRSIPPQPESTC
ncbi:hypothetical protein RRG08_044859 [Elysia crispata]|uniref:Uncharacterized protein n=1 Tax=Elysia crispata TaxID=231223 RepID=A0AAE1A3Q8_9GAST|nr:hypothetical protein RRG08_044859 [Elysia crispata]